MNDPGMTSEQRAAVAVHNATHARQCLASVNEQGWGQDGTLCQRCAEVADQIDAAVEVERQAAEERGRRRGVEERDELRALLSSLLRNFDTDSDAYCRITAAIAPRDSALGAKVGRSEDGLPVVNLDRDALHGKAPRDSAPAIPSISSQGCPECSKPQPGDLGMGSIEARQLRCQHKPRDSGKENT